MSEVVAKYMGWVSKEGYYSHDGLICWHFIEAKLDKNWNRLHEVWEKVSTEEVDGMNNYWYQIELALCGNEKEETLWALYRAIIFIQQLK